ncbi:hypothetical protein JD974_22785 [Chromobacterium haemolyticum]|uniref:Polysaccharide biosynthesis protein n=1 Tax=Chromobacterium haemolyticum TaxID=394935 RepID=A0ABS3GUC6_9NEIS|nr:hypothetical protein [Chromobacterium haemolyticum]MBK0417241.1 hypothetical protein [Chromobacterium haemolyticum]MBO0418378.1 hypothetical protein [Chromobacterium haemolyticum]MBO0501691.1 hypothetical protein [Chromobacterium haemolyticum]BBH14714.1 hypothetical protein CH06BL_39620 [Chromobacterium haemolyticum]
MRHFRSAGIYAASNACIAFSGLLLTLAIGKLFGVARFGELASFIALQNIWAALGFMRIETRLATSSNSVEADKILMAGFLAGAVLSSLAAVVCFLIFRSGHHYWLIFLSGFALCVFDALSLRSAFSGEQRKVIVMRALRILAPLFIALVAALLTNQVDVVVLWQAGGTVAIALLVWRRWIGLRRWARLTRALLRRHWAGLVPSLLLCFLNGVWLNGLAPFLNAFASPTAAGQFSMLQRVLGGSLGLISTATAMVFVRQDYVRAGLAGVKRIFLVNLACSLLFCLVLAVPFLSGMSESWLGAGWRYRGDFYFSMSMFLTFSFSVGAISMLAVRLRDEWFLTIWQAAALLIWGGVFGLFAQAHALNLALNAGAVMYIILGLRWRYLLKKNS